MSCTQKIHFNKPIHNITISHDGTLLAVGMGEDGASMHTRFGNYIKTVHDEGSAVSTMAFSPAGFLPQLIVTSSSDGYVRVLDCDSGACFARLRSYLRKTVHHVTFSPNGRLLAAAIGKKYVQLWRTDNWDFPPVLLKCGVTWPLRIAFSCDSQFIVTNSIKKRLWQILDNDAVAVAIPNMDGESPYCLAFSPTDNKLLACGGEDVNSLVLSRVCEDAIVIEHRLQGHARYVWSVAFSPCGKQLASASSDTTVRLWNVATGACLRVLSGHIDGAFGVVFFPDGKQLATFSLENIVHIWTLCPWRDFTHHLFGARLKAAVFTLMCVRARLRFELVQQSLPRLPMELWLLVFGQLALIINE